MYTYKKNSHVHIPIFIHTRFICVYLYMYTHICKYQKGNICWPLIQFITIHASKIYKEKRGSKHTQNVNNEILCGRIYSPSFSILDFSLFFTLPMFWVLVWFLREDIRSSSPVSQGTPWASYKCGQLVPRTFTRDVRERVQWLSPKKSSHVFLPLSSQNRSEFFHGNPASCLLR